MASWAGTLLLINCLLIVVSQLAATELRQLSFTVITSLQQHQHNNHSAGFSPYQDRVTWALAEALGPDPKFATMLLCLLVASNGEEATLWLVARFLAAYTRWALGMVLKEPRPSWLSSEVRMLHCAQTFGMPAGHAILCSSLAILFCARRRWYWSLVALVWYCGMCWGRLFLGTHSIQDLVIGTTIGVNIAAFALEGGGGGGSSIRLVQDMRRFFYEQGFWFITLFVGFGVTSSIGLASSLSELAAHNRPALDDYAQRVAQDNHCPKIHPFHALEGSMAVAGLAGLLLSMSLGNTKLVTTLARRALVVGVFVLPSVANFVVAASSSPKQFWTSLGLPPYSLQVLIVFCNFCCVALAFTSPTATRGGEGGGGSHSSAAERRRLLLFQAAQLRDETAASAPREASLYGSVPPRQV